jgi:hypothetical protein
MTDKLIVSNQGALRQSMAGQGFRRSEPHSMG